MYTDIRLSIPQYRTSMMWQEVAVVTIVYAAITVFLSLFLWLSHDGARLLTKEDGPVENATVLLFMASALGMTYMFFSAKHRVQNGRKHGWMYLLLGVLFFVCAMEEISWGQRLFNFEIQAIQAVNNQNETNLHNLKAFQYIGEYVPFLKQFLHPDRLFTAFMFLLAVVIPVAYGFSTTLRRCIQRIGLPVMSIAVSGACLFAYVLPEVLMLMVTIPEAHHTLREVQEALYALSLAFFTLFTMRHHTMMPVAE